MTPRRIAAAPNIPSRGLRSSIPPAPATPCFAAPALGRGTARRDAGRHGRAEPGARRHSRIARDQPRSGSAAAAGDGHVRRRLGAQSAAPAAPSAVALRAQTARAGRSDARSLQRSRPRFFLRTREVSTVTPQVFALFNGENTHARRSPSPHAPLASPRPTRPQSAAASSSPWPAAAADELAACLAHWQEIDGFCPPRPSRVRCRPARCREADRGERTASS
jgi:hypothetical protein